MKLARETLLQLAQLYGCSPAELQFPPHERDQGQRLHEAMELAQQLDPEVAKKWLEIGRLLKSQQ